MKVRIIEVRCPKCGPRTTWRNDGKGAHPESDWESMPNVVDAQRFREEKQLCECGEPVLIATEPVGGDAQ